MSKLLKLLAAAMLIAGTLAITFDSAAARHRHRHYGYWWGPPGFGYGPGVRYGYYPYYAPYYYGPPACQRYYVRSWRHGRWVLRRVVRCW